MTVTLNPENSTGLSPQLLNNSQPIFQSMFQLKQLRDLIVRGETSKENIRALHYIEKCFGYFMEEDFLPDVFRKLVAKLTDPEEIKFFKSCETGIQ